MRRLALILAAAAGLVAPDMALAQAGQAKMRDNPRNAPAQQNGAHRNILSGASAPMERVIANVEAGRRGRLLDVDVAQNGVDYVAIWEYPDGRVRNIPVDGRTGRPVEP